MPAWICRTCAVQHAETIEPPEVCVICEDERQYLPPQGQQWTTAADLARDHRTELRDLEPGLLGVGVDPDLGIGQRALLVSTPSGNVLWDCVPLLDDDAREEIRARGGIDAICVSHPHFHAAMVDVADAFGATIHLPAADRRWVLRPSPRIRYFEDSVEPVPGVEVRRLGGHFAGASVLHWPAGAGGAGALLTGDTITVVPDTGWVSFMWSYPNLLPLDAGTVERVAAGVRDLAFDRIYGGWWERVLDHDGAAAVQRSAQRYVARLRGDRPDGS